jgi:hypothetical protein
MHYRPAYTMELPFERFHPVGDYTDNVASEHHVNSSDQLAIHLHLSYIPTLPDVSVAGQSSESPHFSYHDLLVSNCHERYALAFSFMAKSPLASPGISGEVCEKARTYSVEELLTMRDKLPFVICNVNKLNPRVTSGMNSSVPL